MTNDSWINASGSIFYNANNIVAASGVIPYIMGEDAIREGFQELFKQEFTTESINKLLDTPLSPDQETRDRMLRDRMSRPLPPSKAAPPPKATPPLSQRPKPIMNRKGRVKRAFDFDD